MKIFIFERIDKVSNNWHPEGGLVIIAKDKESANALIAANGSISISDEEWGKVEEFNIEKDAVPKYWVMPDAGCC